MKTYPCQQQEKNVKNCHPIFGFPGPSSVVHHNCHRQKLLLGPAINLFYDTIQTISHLTQIAILRS